MMKQLLLFLILVPLCFMAVAQAYTATYGSPYAGSTGIRNNPSASINSAFKWELTLFSAQAKLSSNTIKIENGSFFPGNTYSSRYLHNNVDLSLLNALYRINDQQAVSFNLRARTYNHLKSLPLSTSDTNQSLHDFLVTNRNTAFIEGFGHHMGWIQADFNYSQVFSQTATSRLTGGITLQWMKGVSGAFAKVNRVTFLEAKTSTDTVYTLNSGGAAFAYSSNYDAASGKDFIKESANGIGLSMGMEYLVYDTESDAEHSNTILNYAWKIGISLMDLGSIRFKASPLSTAYRNLNTNITDILVDNKLGGVETIQQARDSLNTIFAGNESIGESFTISNPTRLVIQVDRRLGNNLFVNGDLSLNFFSTSSYKKLRTRELNLLTVTPRWETPAFGVYLPMQYNTQGQFWLGAAVKLGPLTLGMHNIAWIKKMENANGGGYLMLRFHPFSKKKVVSKLDCPD